MASFPEGDLLQRHMSTIARDNRGVKLFWGRRLASSIYSFNILGSRSSKFGGWFWPGVADSGLTDFEIAGLGQDSGSSNSQVLKGVRDGIH